MDFAGYPAGVSGRKQRAVSAGIDMKMLAGLQMIVKTL